MAVIWLVVGLAALLFGAELLVDGAIEIARFVGVSEVVIGITLVALATSLPELAVSLVSAIRGEYGLAIGNIVGSNIFNLSGRHRCRSGHSAGRPPAHCAVTAHFRHGRVHPGPVCDDLRI